MIYERTSPNQTGHNFNRAAIYKSAGNTVNTSLTNGYNHFDNVKVSPEGMLLPVETIYAGEWVPDEDNLGLTYVGSAPMDAEIKWTYTFDAYATSAPTRKAIGTILTQNAGFLTGSLCSLPIADWYGAMSIGYGRFFPGHTLKCMITADENSTIRLHSAMVVIRPLL